MTTPICPHGHAYGTCLMCYHDLVGEQQSEIEKLRAALKVAQQSLIEVNHAQEAGPTWFTHRESALYRQVNHWLRRGLEAVKDALGPYDDHGKYLKEKVTP